MKEAKVRNKAKQKILIESLFVFFIAISPFLYKLYDYFPDEPEVTISFLDITIGDGGFGEVSMYIWFLMSKIVPLYLFIFWFMTAKNWWYHIILIPIAMYAFQLFEVIYDSDDIVDTENILWLLPILMVVIPFVYFIRIKLYDKYVHGIDLEAMEAELNSIKAKRGESNEKNNAEGANLTNKVENSNQSGEKGQLSSDQLDPKITTDHSEEKSKSFQNILKNWLNLKF